MDLIHSLGLKIDCESLQVNSTESSYIKLPSHIKQFEDLFSPEPGCFLKVKQAIANNITLEFFDPDCETIVTTDASVYGVSGVLSQIKNNKEYIVACASRTLTEHERKYSVGEREALACVWACERWFTYLWGRHFHLRTDHSALTTLLSSHGTGRQPMRIARWNARLLIFD